MLDFELDYMISAWIKYLWIYEYLFIVPSDP